LPLDLEFPPALAMEELEPGKLTIDRVVGKEGSGDPIAKERLAQQPATLFERER
jgi:hypothetical protein